MSFVVAFKTYMLKLYTKNKTKLAFSKGLQQKCVCVKKTKKDLTPSKDLQFKCFVGMLHFVCDCCIHVHVLVVVEDSVSVAVDWRWCWLC